MCTREGRVFVIKQSLIMVLKTGDNTYNFELFTPHIMHLLVRSNTANTT